MKRKTASRRSPVVSGPASIGADWSEMIKDVTLAAAEAETISDALQKALDLIRAYAGWSLGHVYYRGDYPIKSLISTSIWSAEELSRWEIFCEATNSIERDSGAGLPARVLEQRRPVLYPDLGGEDPLRQKAAQECGLLAGIAFPLFAGDEIVAVLEFFSTQPVEEDRAFAEAVLKIGGNLGRLFRRMRADAEVRASQKQLAEAQRIAHLGSWEWDIQSNEITWSDELYRIFGVQPDRFPGTFDAYLDMLHPDERDWVNRVIQDAIQNRGEFDFEHRIVWPDQEVRYVHGHGKVILDRSGKPVRMIGTSQDITDQRRFQEKLRASEVRFRTIFESSALGIAMIDPNRRFLITNPAFQKILGYPAAELWGRNLVDVISPADLEQNSLKIEAVFSGEEDLYRAELHFLRKDGSLVWVNSSLSLARQEDGLPRFVTLIMEDISLRKQMEAELSEVKRRLIAGREQERLFLAQELHDDPLQELYGLMYHLDDFKGYFVDKEGLDELQEAQSTVNRVINTLRNISRELRPPTLAPFGLNGAINELCERFQDDHPEVKFHLDLTCNGKGLTEEARLNLYRILQQALSNIARHAQANEVHVRFRNERHYDILEVEDDGRGFAVPSGWVPFVREGHLGLAGAAERAEIINGRFQVISSPGKGTLIRVVVPDQPVQS